GSSRRPSRRRARPTPARSPPRRWGRGARTTPAYDRCRALPFPSSRSRTTTEPHTVEPSQPEAPAPGCASACAAAPRAQPGEVVSQRSPFTGRRDHLAQGSEVPAGDAGDGQDGVVAGLADARHRAELAEQRLPGRGAEAGDVVDLGAEAAGLAQLL